MSGGTSNLLKASMLVTAATFMTRVLGLGRDVTLGWMYGTGDITDAYLVASTIPNFLVASITIALTSAFTPIYSELAVASPGRARSFASSILNIVGLAAMLISIAGVVFAPRLLAVIAPGLRPDAASLATQMARWMIPGSLMIALSAVVSAILMAHNRFAQPAFAGFWQNLIIIVLMITLGSKMQTRGLSIAYTVSVTVLLVTQLPALIQERYRHTWTAAVTEDVRVWWRLFVPNVLSLLVDQVSVLSARILGSLLETGSITAFVFATRINNVPFGLAAVPVASALAPRLSRIRGDDGASAHDDIQWAMNLVLLLTMPLAVMFLTGGTPLVSLLFERGAFDHRAAIATGNILTFFAPGLVFGGVREILRRVFLAAHNSWILTVTAIGQVTISIGLGWSLVGLLGVRALGLAPTVSIVVAAVWMSAWARRDRLVPRFWRHRTVLVIGVGACVQLAVSGVSLLSDSLMIQLVGIGLSATAYAVVLYTAQVPEFLEIIGVLNGKARSLLRTR